MGRFASHLAAVSEQTKPCSFTSLEYTSVDYAHLTALANESLDNCSEQHRSAFRDAWKMELARSTANVDKHYETATRIIIDALIDCNNSTDEEEQDLATALADPHIAIEILMKYKPRDFVVNLLTDFKVLLKSTSLNSEALIRSLKKYDKRTAAAANAGMMRELLPKLYASTTYHATGAKTLSGHIQIFREFLEESDDDDSAIVENRDTDKLPQDTRRLSETSESVREDEYKWFMSSVKGLSDKELASLVAHRGFHCEEDDSVKRPIENSLSSFEYCWGAGVHLAECDVGVTKDEKIIMAHDEDFKRLALISDMNESNFAVKDLTLGDVIRMPLKAGSRPPLLIDVLRSAMAIGGNAKLVIEVKPGNAEIVDPLMILFKRHPALLSRVAVIMSFDAYIMQDIADNFAMQNLTGVAGGSLLGVIGEGSQTTTVLSRPSQRMTNRRRGRKSRAMPIQSVSYGLASEADEEASVPKLLVLTAWVPYDDFDGYIVTSVKNGFEGLSDKLPVDRGFDGIYLEYEPEMLEPEGREKMLKLAETYIVGVWMLKPRDPDALSVAKKLVGECGVSYVNTDFHHDFFSS